MSGNQTAPAPAPVVPQFYFVLDANGTPRFYNSLFSVVPAGATPISFAVYRLYQQNPNLLLTTFKLPDGTDVTYAVAPLPQISDQQLVGLLTPAEYAVGLIVGLRLAVNATDPTGATIIGGVFNGVAFHGGDLSSQTFFGWLMTLVVEGVVDPSRPPYILAGQPPAADAPPPPFLLAQAAAAAAASGGTAPAS